MKYQTDPEKIYRDSFAHVRQNLDLARHDHSAARVIERVVHACGMLNLVDDIRYSRRFVDAGTAALAEGKPVFCDCNMVASGIIRRHLEMNNEVITTIDHPDLAEHKTLETTRSAAAIDLWGAGIDGSIAVIGNAPTALFRLLERVEDHSVRPALIIGIPVGFIGASESKQALINCPRDIEYFTVKGTRGGSAMASATLNAVALLSSESRKRQAGTGGVR